uniref:Uncharacterized protein n=1 Tax=Oryza rufipogon TaxID=4529 RepID=A0A0E0NR68_ORYRU
MPVALAAAAVARCNFPLHPGSTCGTIHVTRILWTEKYFLKEEMICGMLHSWIARYIIIS